MTRIRHVSAALYWLIALACCGVIAHSAFLAPPRLTADQPKDDAKKQALKSLQGEWKVESWLSDGTQTTPPTRIVFRGDTYSMVPDTTPSIVGEFRFQFQLDVDNKPWVIRQKITSAFNSGFTRAVIIRVSGDTLEMCYHSESTKKDVPPKTFDGKKGSGQDLITLKRLKASKTDKEK